MITTPVFLPGKSHGQRSLVGYSPWNCKRTGDTSVTKQQEETQVGKPRPKARLTPGSKRPFLQPTGSVYTRKAEDGLKPLLSSIKSGILGVKTLSLRDTSKPELAANLEHLSVFVGAHPLAPVWSLLLREDAPRGAPDPRTWVIHWAGVSQSCLTRRRLSQSPPVVPTADAKRGSSGEGASKDIG